MVIDAYYSIFLQTFHALFYKVASAWHSLRVSVVQYQIGLKSLFGTEQGFPRILKQIYKL